MRRFVLFLIALAISASMDAQYAVSDNYQVWFEDYAEEVVTRKAVDCSEHGQDLWNGCWVKISNGYVYIYNGRDKILYGDEVNLLYNGYYRVKRSGTWYLADEDGDLVSGIYGKDIYYYPFGYVTVQRSSGYWDIYHCSGRKLDCYSDEAPLVLRNGFFLIKQGRYWYAVDSDGDKIDGVYGDEIILLNDGRWKCIRGNYVQYI